MHIKLVHIPIVGGREGREMIQEILQETLLISSTSSEKHMI